MAYNKNSNRFAITFPHFSHSEISNGSYIGIITLTLGSGKGFYLMEQDFDFVNIVLYYLLDEDC